MASESRDPPSRGLPRFASRAPPRERWTAMRVLEVVHKMLTGGAALAAIIRFLF